jgi:pyruvate kinase
VTGRDVEGRSATRDDRGQVVEPACIACTLPEALTRVAAGHRVLFDDGKLEGVVEHVEHGDVHVRIRRTPPGGGKLRAEKGINLPDSELPVPSLTAEDHAHLGFVARHADLVGLSFVRRPEDVRTLHEALRALGRSDIGVVLKIETRAGFEALPRILLEAMRRPPVAVMIARGDLAVEMGFERLAEVQEEILWLCEAAHVPVIWATQVLEGMATKGSPSRAEVSDAVMSGRAECVMLNKGPYIVETVHFLNNILERMDAHQSKKRSMLRRLSISEVD